MENYCHSCSANPYVAASNTWSEKGNLTPSSYNPFPGMGLSPPTVVEPYYASLGNSWTRAANVTPQNSPDFDSAFLLEKYNIRPNPVNYVNLGKTWAAQKPYTL